MSRDERVLTRPGLFVLLFGLGCVLSIALPTLEELVAATLAADGEGSGSRAHAAYESSAPAAPSSEVSGKALAGQIGGAANAVAVDEAGRTAYIAVGPRVLALDITTPGSPVRLGQSQVLDGVVQSLVLRGGQVIAGGARGGVWVIDVTNPAAPLLLGSLPSPTGSLCAIRKAVVIDDYALAAAGRAGLLVIDVAEATGPRLVATVPMPGDVTGVDAAGSAAVVSLDRGKSEGALHVLDISDPAAPATVAGTLTPKPAVDVVLEPSGLTYVAERDGLRIFDVGGRGDPREVGSVPVDDLEAIPPVHRLVVADGYAYIGMGISVDWLSDDVAFRGGLHIVDVRNPEEPEVVAYYQLLPGLVSNGFVDVAVHGDTVLAMERVAGLVVLDASNRWAPAKVGSYETGGLAHSVALSPGKGHLAAGWGLWTMDLSSPTRPRLAGYSPATSSLTYVEVADGRLYASESGFFHNVTTISELGGQGRHGRLPFRTRDVAGADGYAYLARYGPQRGVLAYDVRDPRQPNQVATVLEGSYRSFSLDLAPPHLFVTDDRYLRVCDVADPTDPRWVSQPLDLGSGHAQAIEVAGDVAVILDRSGIQLFDVSDPAQADYLAQLELQSGSTVGKMALDRGLVYLLAGTQLHVVDVSDPRVPAELRSVSTVGFGSGMAAGRDHVYVAAGDAGLLIYRRNLLAAPSPTATATITRGPPSPSPTYPSPTPTVHRHICIQGDVLDWHTGAGVEGATVEVTDCDGYARSIETDQAGHYDFRCSHTNANFESCGEGYFEATAPGYKGVERVVPIPHLLPWARVDERFRLRRLPTSEVHLPLAYG